MKIKKKAIPINFNFSYFFLLTFLYIIMIFKKIKLMNSKVKKQNVGIFLFDSVEILDFAGPYEVFASTRLTKKVMR